LWRRWRGKDLLILGSCRAGPGCHGEAKERLRSSLLFGRGRLRQQSGSGDRGRGHARVVRDQWFVNADARVIDQMRGYRPGMVMCSAGTGCA
jgi:hypothetical protein